MAGAHAFAYAQLLFALKDKLENKVQMLRQYPAIHSCTISSDPDMQAGCCYTLA